MVKATVGLRYNRAWSILIAVCYLHHIKLYLQGDTEWILYDLVLSSSKECSYMIQIPITTRISDNNNRDSIHGSLAWLWSCAISVPRVMWICIARNSLYHTVFVY